MMRGVGGWCVVSVRPLGRVPPGSGLSCSGRGGVSCSANMAARWALMVAVLIAWPGAALRGRAGRVMVCSSGGAVNGDAGSWRARGTGAGRCAWTMVRGSGVDTGRRPDDGVRQDPSSCRTMDGFRCAERARVSTGGTDRGYRRPVRPHARGGVLMPGLDIGERRRRRSRGTSTPSWLTELWV